MTPERVTFQLLNALGDTIVLSGALRDLQLQHPGRYQIGVHTHCQSLWDQHPFVRSYEQPGRLLDVNYREEMTRANRGNRRHFLGAFHDIIARQLGIPLTVSVPRPELYLTSADRHPPVPTPYWVIAPGWKEDMPAKAWSLQYWQQLLETLHSWGIQTVQAGAGSNINPILSPTCSLVANTNIRQLARLVQGAEGVICGITSLMHIAAAFEKPCVVIAGGREAWWWEAYTNENPGFGEASGKIRVPHRYLHTIGQLDCCQQTGCEKRGLLSSRRHKPREVCTSQLKHADQFFSMCLGMITPDMVAEAVLSYYRDGTLDRQSLKLPLAQLLPILSTSPEVILTPNLDENTRKNTEITENHSSHTRFTIPERPQPSENRIWSHSTVENRVTLCILGYGDHFDILRRCLDGVLRTTSPEQVEIRVGGNALTQTSTDYLRQLWDTGEVQQLNLSSENRYKYPVMRELFRQPPLTTQWVVWLDDDAEIVSPDWLERMLRLVVSQYPAGIRWAGPLYQYTLTPRWERWCADAAWWQSNKRPWSTTGKILFCSGGLWIAHVPTLLQADIPDARLENNKGDVTIGLQMYQLGAVAANFAPRKEHVLWSNSPRRGATTTHPAET